MSGEFDLIREIRRNAKPHPFLDVGIGDDAAVLSIPQHQLVTSDQLMDGVHFRVDEQELNLIGRKALAVSLSDVAAMAGIPDAAFVGVSLPKSFQGSQAKQLFGGIQKLADEFKVAIAGGDTTTWDGPLVINTTVIGHSAGPPVLRSGAQVGDVICVTGPLGGSLLGKHLSFTPRVTEAQELNRRCSIHSMIDISDGLVADLAHILEESDCGATLDEADIPISDDAYNMSDEKTPLEHALSDGEDFELLLTMSEADYGLMQENDNASNLIRIGTIESEPGCRMRQTSGEVVPLEPIGWEHQLESDGDG